MPESAVAIVRCGDYQSQSVYEAVKRACDLAGGISAIVNPGDKVLIKPCIVKAVEPEEGICTHPEVVRAVIRLVKKAGGYPIVGDSPIGIADIDEVYTVSGIKRVCNDEQAELVKFIEAEIVNGIPIAKPALYSDVVISIPKFKTHGLTILTGAIKSIFGVVPGLFKVKCHKLFPKDEDFSRTLVNIFSYVKPQFTVVDGIVAMEGNGPVAGNLRNTGIILASADSVAVDAVLTRIIGLDSFRVFTTRYAHEMNLGIGMPEDIKIFGENPDNIAIKKFKLPTTIPFFNLSVVMLKMVGTTTINFNKPAVRKKLCILCGKCAAICPCGAINSKDGEIHFDYKKCKLCLCCMEACPRNAVYINKGILDVLEQVKEKTKLKANRKS